MTAGRRSSPRGGSGIGLRDGPHACRSRRRRCGAGLDAGARPAAAAERIEAIGRPCARHRRRHRRREDRGRRVRSDAARAGRHRRRGCLRGACSAKAARCSRRRSRISSTSWAVNVRGSFLVVREAARHMRPRRAGAIVLLSSLDGLQAEHGMFSYCTSKGALLNMARAAALDLARDGITVNCVCPERHVHAAARRPARHHPQRGRGASLLRRASPVGACSHLAGHRLGHRLRHVSARQRYHRAPPYRSIRASERPGTISETRPGSTREVSCGPPGAGARADNARGLRSAAHLGRAPRRARRCGWRSRLRRRPAPRAPGRARGPGVRHRSGRTRRHPARAPRSRGRRRCGHGSGCSGWRSLCAGRGALLGPEP